jgi:hypothetical protein
MLSSATELPQGISFGLLLVSHSLCTQEIISTMVKGIQCMQGKFNHQLEQAPRVAMLELSLVV